MVGCTLSMDDPEDLRVFHTDKEYIEGESMELPDGMGTVTYRYNQKTIPITDEVEKWIVKVEVTESDTIIYFADGTPEELMPEVGEMMTCSFREKFPDAFCHRCIERTKEAGLYRCVFTPCSIADAFDDFQVDASPTSTYDVGDEEDLTEEEFDSLMYGGSETAEARAARAAWKSNTWTRADKKENKPFARLKKKFPEHKLTVSTGSNGLSGSASCGGSITLKGSTGLLYNKDTGKLHLDTYWDGEINLWFKVEASAGVTLKYPDDICLKGIKFDLGVVGVKSGLFLNPYFTVQEKISGTLNISWKFTTAMEADQATYQSKPGYSVREDGAGCYRPKVTFDGNSTPQLHVEAGMDIYIAMGFDVAKVGVDARGGMKFYCELNQDIDTKKYQSPEDFKQKNANFPLYAIAYLKGTVSYSVADKEKGIYSDPIVVSNKLKVPFFPEVSEAYFYCDNYKSKRYKANYKLKTVGIVGYMLDYLPYLRIFDEFGDMIKEVRMDFKENLTAGEKTWIDEEEIIRKNTKYKVQVGFKALGQYWLPLRDIPFTYEWPECMVNYADVIISRKASSLGSDYKFISPFNENHEYDYMYIIDVQMAMSGLRSIVRWGFDMKRPTRSTDDKPVKYRFLNKITGASVLHNKDKAVVNVRFRWYTNHGYRDQYGNWHREYPELVNFLGIFSVMNNGKESSVNYIDNIHADKAPVELEYDKTLDRELTKDEEREFKKDPYNFDFIQDNIYDNPNFSYWDTRNGSNKSREYGYWGNEDEEYVEVVVADEE